jgi:hypothetical protein
VPDSLVELASQLAAARIIAKGGMPLSEDEMMLCVLESGQLARMSEKLLHANDPEWLRQSKEPVAARVTASIQAAQLDADTGPASSSPRAPRRP